MQLTADNRRLAAKLNMNRQIVNAGGFHDWFRNDRVHVDGNTDYLIIEKLFFRSRKRQNSADNFQNLLYEIKNT